MAAGPGTSYPQKVHEGQPLMAYPGTAAQTSSNFDPTGKYKLKFEGAFAAVEVSVAAGDGLKSQGGVMVTMSDNVDIDTRMEGQGPRGDVLLAPPVPGEIIMLHMDGAHGWTVQPGGFLACDETLSIGVRMLNAAQGCCGGEGFFVMEATGRGRLLVCSYGAITRYDLAPGERRKIDNGYCVAWTSGMHWSVGKATKSLVKSVVSGEGLVNNFTGPGTVFVQTRSLANLASALVPYLPSGGGDGGGGGG